MSRAIVATMNGKEPQDIGEKSIDSKDSWKAGVKKSSLRITAVFKFIDPAVHEKVKMYPAHCLHLLGCPEELKECKTSGWTFDEDEKIMVGYCLVDPGVIEQLLGLSGAGGVFISQLKQDIVTRPPVTWHAQLEKEDDITFHRRISEIAKENSVAMTWRRGGGLCLGVTMEDKTERAHSWVCHGIPSSWGPLTVKEFLEKHSWKLSVRPSPPKGRNKGWFIVGYVEGKQDPSYTYLLCAAAEGQSERHVSVRKWEKVRRIDTNVVKITGGGLLTTYMMIRLRLRRSSTALESGNSMEVDLEIKRRRDDPADSSSKRVKGGGKGKGKRLAGGQPGPGGSSLLDTGGKGDCGWRALSYMLTELNTRKSSSDIIEKIEVISKTLRAKTISQQGLRRLMWPPFCRFCSALFDGYVDYRWLR